MSDKVELDSEDLPPEAAELENPVIISQRELNALEAMAEMNKKIRQLRAEANDE